MKQTSVTKWAGGFFPGGTALVAFVLTLVFTASGCARSDAYRKDQDYSSEVPKSYYSRPGSTEGPARRLEQMGQPRKRVAVLNFWNDTPVVGDLGPFAADELRRGLQLTQRVLLPPDARSTLETKDFVQGMNIKVAQLVREGRKLGVAVVIVGRISKVVFRQRGDDVGLLRQTQSLAAVEVELKVFDIAAGREISAIGRSGEASTNSMVAVETENLQSRGYRAELAQLAIREAVASIGPEVIKSIEKMTWEGRIAKILGNKVYLNAGRASGIVAGDILRVMAPGDDLYDPTTGAYLGKTEGQLKGTLEVLDFVGDDGAASTIHTGGNFKEGDTVRLY